MSFEKQRKWKRPEMTPMPETAAGETVMSLSGRDKGRIYTVKDTYTDKYGRHFAVLSSDEKRKVKNLRQLAMLPYTHQSRKQAKKDMEG